MNAKKKIISLTLAACLMAVAVVGSSLAYFTDTEEKDNVFTVGNVTIALTEPNWKGADESAGEGLDESSCEDAGSQDAVYPGEPLAKDPIVTNIGKNPCFVRIQIDGLEQFGEKGSIGYRTDSVDGKLGDGWVGYGDCFYYTEVLEVGDSTDALFDQIVMPIGLTGDETAQSINVTAEAVQAQGACPDWSDVQAMTVEEIAAWFGTCGMN